MRAAAHVEPGAFFVWGPRPIDGEFLVFGKFARPFGLEAFAIGGPFGDELFAAPHFAVQRLVGADDGAHRVFDGGQIIHAERLAALGRLHVVIEPVVGRGAEGDLRAGEQCLHRLGQHVSIIVAREFERVGLIAGCHQREVGIAFERAGEVAQFPVNARGNRRLGKAGANRGGNVRRGRSGGHFAHRSIGQADLEQFGHCRKSVWFGRALGQAGAHRKSGVEQITVGGRTPRRPEPGGGPRA